MKEVIVNKDLVAYCGLYCGACGSYLKGRCPGCHENAKATWCKIRSCCAEHAFSTCAVCGDFKDPNDCRKFNNFIAKAFGVIFNSNRQACIYKIREVGIESYAEYMAQRRKQSLPRRGIQSWPNTHVQIALLGRDMIVNRSLSSGDCGVGMRTGVRDFEAICFRFPRKSAECSLRNISWWIDQLYG